MGMNASQPFHILLCAIAGILVLPGRCWAGIDLPPDARGSTVWAAGRLRTALGERFADAQVVLHRVASSGQAAESFGIAVDGPVLRVRAGDGNGEMYGLLELAEEASSSEETTWGQFVGGFKPVAQQPAIGFRADNAFLHIDRKGVGYLLQKIGLLRPQRLLADREMWRQYIDMLAENRYNVLDLHGIYNIANTSFQNILPHLVSVPDYPSVGNSKSQRQNLRDLRGLISYANKRGVKVGVMNYSAKVDGLTGEQLKDYIAKAVAILLREIPKLRLFGFRVGESGEPAEFLGAAYLKGIHDSGRSDVSVYTRSWKTTPEELNKLGEGLAGRLDVEVKYNGEHLGLPYQAIQGPANSHYSYDGFMARGMNYNTIWQIRANGTHRFWAWAGTEFIRRTMKSVSFGGAHGFSLEPETAYYPLETARYYKPAAASKACQFIWQKDWPWYLAWGRLGYDPDLSEETLRSAFRLHYGDDGDAIYLAMQASSQVVPMALAYRFTGPDQRNMSPETQTGAFDTQKRGMKVGPLSFAENAPMDPRSFAGVDEFVKEKIAGKPDGRIGPARIAALFASASAGTLDALGKAPGGGRVHPEASLIEIDLRCAADLGAYYAERILGTMHLDYALKAGSATDYTIALDHLARSRSEWTRLASAADAAFLPIQDPMIGQRDYTWSSQIDLLNKLDAGVPALWNAVPHRPEAAPLRLTPAEEGALAKFEVATLRHELESGAKARIRCAAAHPEALQKLTCWAKEFPSDAEWKPHPMSPDPTGEWSCIVPLDPSGILYLVAMEGESGEAAQYPSPLVETPYRVISAAEIASFKRRTLDPKKMQPPGVE